VFAVDLGTDLPGFLLVDSDVRHVGLVETIAAGTVALRLVSPDGRFWALGASSG
jgi:hypothetical protein